MLTAAASLTRGVGRSGASFIRGLVARAASRDLLPFKEEILQLWPGEEAVASNHADRLEVPRRVPDHCSCRSTRRYDEKIDEETRTADTCARMRAFWLAPLGETYDQPTATPTCPIERGTKLEALQSLG